MRTLFRGRKRPISLPFVATVVACVLVFTLALFGVGLSGWYLYALVVGLLMAATFTDLAR